MKRDRRQAARTHTIIFHSSDQPVNPVHNSNGPERCGVYWDSNILGDLYRKRVFVVQRQQMDKSGDGALWHECVGAWLDYDVLDEI
jgi:hypothetical protein